MLHKIFLVSFCMTKFVWIEVVSSQLIFFVLTKEFEPISSSTRSRMTFSNDVMLQPFKIMLISPYDILLKLRKKYLDCLNFVIFINQSKVIGFGKKIVKWKEHDENYNLALANDWRDSCITECAQWKMSKKCNFTKKKNCDQC